MYSVKYKAFGTNVIKEGLSVNALRTLTRKLSKASNITAINNTTNEVVRVVVKPNTVYFNKSTEIWFSEDDFIKLSNLDKRSNKAPAALRDYKAVLYKTRNFKPRFLQSPCKVTYRVSYNKDIVQEVFAKTTEGWSPIYKFNKDAYLENYWDSILKHEAKVREQKEQKAKEFEEYKQRVIAKDGFWSYDAKQTKVFIVNEVKGITEAYKERNNLIIPVRNRDQMIAMSLDKSTIMQPVIIICSHHSFKQDLVDCNITLKRTTQRKTKTFIKSSFVLTLATNLYNAGCPSIKLCDVRNIDETIDSRSVTITKADNIWSKLQEFCELWDSKESKISQSIREDSITKKLSKQFTKYASIYNLDPTSEQDEAIFKFLIQFPEAAEDFLDGTKFKCPHCGEIVYTNRNYTFHHGRYINTGETICDYCGVKFDIHDKKDILAQILHQDVDMSDGYINE